MKNVIINTDSLGECWLHTIQHVMNYGDNFYDEDVQIKEILGVSVKIDKPDMNDAIINKFGDKNIVEHTINKFSNGNVIKNRPFTYGQRIYDKNGVNQFEWIVDRLNNKKETKSASICLLVEGDKSENLPCLTTIDVKIRDNKLNLQFFFRSQNIVGRQYANLLAITKLQQDLSDRFSTENGFISGYIASAHIYEYDYDYAQSIIENRNIQVVDRFYSHGPKSIRENIIFK